MIKLIWKICLTAILSITAVSSEATTFTWKELGGAPCDIGCLVEFAPIKVNHIDQINDVAYTSGVGGYDVLSFYLYASAKVDGEWKVFAKANNLIIRFQETSAINFQILENISGNVSGLYLGYSQYGVGTYTNVYNNTSFVFSNIATPTTPVPEPSTYGMMLIGLFFIGYMRRSRKQAAYLPL